MPYAMMFCAFCVAAMYCDDEGHDGLTVVMVLGALCSLAYHLYERVPAL